MIIDCEQNPENLVDKIGDRFFLLCAEDVDEPMRGKDYPHTIRIIDCENGVTIDITTDYGVESTLESAKALTTLLNQGYKIL